MAQKMLRPGTLALRNLKRHKRQYAAMVTGIILALVFASGLTYFTYCYREAVDAMIRDRVGNEDEIVIHANEAFIDDVQAKGLIETSGYAHIIGYAYTDEAHKENGTSVAWLDNTAKKLSNATLLSGAWPEKTNEIAIEQTALAQMKPDAEVGDTITLQLQIQNGNALLDKTVKKTYVLTGILKDKRVNIYKYLTLIESDTKADMPAAFVCAGTQTEPGGLEALTCYITYAPGSAKERAETFGTLPYVDEDAPNGYLADIENTRTNIWYQNSDSSDFRGNRFQPIALLCGVLLAAACAAVINAFNSNLKARKRQIGMLRAVGATKGQIRQMYGTEALILALICVPVSLLITFFGVRILIAALNREFIFVPNIWVLLLCGLFGLVCVLLAALIPLIAATRISPIQAIRNIGATRKMKTKHIRTQKAFRLPTLLAARRTTFSKGRQVVVSLFLAIAVIVSGYATSYAAGNLNQIKNAHDIYDYGLDSGDNSTAYGFSNVLSEQSGFTESDRQAVLRNPYIESSAGTKICNVNLPIDTFTNYLDLIMLNSPVFTLNDYQTQNANQLTSENYRSLLFQEKSGDYSIYQSYMDNRDYLPAVLVAVDDSVLKQLAAHAADGTIDPARIDRGEEVVLIAPEQIGLYATEPQHGSSAVEYDINEDVQNHAHSYFATAARDETLAAGAPLELVFLTSKNAPTAENSTQKTRDWQLDTSRKQTVIGAVLNDGTDEAPRYSQITLITSNSGMKRLYGDQPYYSLTFTLNQPCTEEIDRAVQSTLNEITARVDTASSWSTYASLEQQKDDTVNMVAVIFCAIIVVLTFCGAIVNNTITADIRENRRELGTLRAVGASAKELSQAYILQLFKMLGWGSAIGLFGFAGSYLIVWIVCRIKYGPNSMEFIFTPWFSILFCVILFAVCSLNLYVKIKHETKNSIVDNIRELG